MLTDRKPPLARACEHAILEAGAAAGFSPPSATEAAAAREAAGNLMGHEVAQVETILALLALQPASTLVFHENGAVAGFASTLLLRPEAEAELIAGRFDGLEPQDSLICRAEDAVGLYYVWGVGGATKTASSAVMRFCHKLRYEALPGLTSYALAVTPVGRHVGLTQLEYRPARHPDDNLIVSPPVAKRRAA